MKYFWIAFGGALGALARYGVAEWAQQRFPSRFPWGTFIINISGSLLIGFIIVILDARLPGPSAWRYALPIGFIGAYTTFSTFELETYRAIHAEWFIVAGAYLAGSIVLGLFSVWAGEHLGSFFIRIID